jgi:hypothetical protein
MDLKELLSEDMTITIKRLRVEKEQDWVASNNNVPILTIPEGVKIQILMPTNNATVRFFAFLPDGTRKSIYWDDKGALAAMDKPYWEVYPVNGDVSRHYADDEDGLWEAIKAPI